MMKKMIINAIKVCLTERERKRRRDRESKNKRETEKRQASRLLRKERDKRPHKEERDNVG